MRSLLQKLVLAAAVVALPAASFGAVFLSVGFAPPALPAPMPAGAAAAAPDPAPAARRHSAFHKKLYRRLTAPAAMESLIAEAVVASSTDNLTESIHNVTSPRSSRGMGYWSSAGSQVGWGSAGCSVPRGLPVWLHHGQQPAGTGRHGRAQLDRPPAGTVRHGRDKKQPGRYPPSPPSTF